MFVTHIKIGSIISGIASYGTSGLLYPVGGAMLGCGTAVCATAGTALACKNVYDRKRNFYEMRRNLFQMKFEIKMNKTIFVTFKEEYVYNTQKLWDIIEFNISASLMRESNRVDSCLWSHFAVLKIKKTKTSVSLMIDTIYVTPISLCCGIFLQQSENFEIQITIKLPSNEPFSEEIKTTQIKDYSQGERITNVEEKSTEYEEIKPYWQIVFPNLFKEIWDHHVEPYVSIEYKETLTNLYDGYVAQLDEQCQTTPNTPTAPNINSEMHGPTMK